MNREKTTVLRNVHTEPYVGKIDGKEIEEVENYIFLRQRINVKDKGMSNEFDRKNTGKVEFIKKISSSPKHAFQTV